MMTDYMMTHMYQCVNIQVKMKKLKYFYDLYIRIQQPTTTTNQKMNSKASQLSIDHCSNILQKQDNERKYFNSLSQEEKAKQICIQIESVLEYEDCLEQYTNEETDNLSAKIASGTTNTDDYTDDELEVMNMFYYYHEESINDANEEIKYIFDICLYVWFNSN